jgi:hypothetical protein
LQWLNLQSAITYASGSSPSCFEFYWLW